jgi:DNA helicase HerA-like ATPase
MIHPDSSVAESEHIEPAVRWAGLPMFLVFGAFFLAREMRKFNLVVSIIDQRPSKIDDEVMSQLGNRIVLSLKDPEDLAAACSGIPKAKVWTNIAQSIPPRTALIVGDAVNVPTVVDVLDYSKIDGMLMAGKEDRMSSDQIKKVAKDAERIVRAIK